MVRAWVYNDADTSDKREPHQHDPIQEVSLKQLSDLGVLYWTVDASEAEANPTGGRLGEIRKARGYKNHDVIHVRPDKLPNYEEKLVIFFTEHLHEDEEIRFVLDGQGYFDVRRTTDDQWIRIFVKKGDMIVLPAGIYHRFTLDTTNALTAMRLFQDAPKWEAINRSEKTETLKVRTTYLETLEQIQKTKEEQKYGATSVNGQSYIIQEGAQALANYPHMRRTHGLLYVSGISSRRADNTHRGAKQRADGHWDLDIEEQTRGVIDNIINILLHANADLSHIIDATVYLTDMKNYQGFNRVWNNYFDPVLGPTRTTVAVHQLPHPNLLIEIKVVAVDPKSSNNNNNTATNGSA